VDVGYSRAEGEVPRVPNVDVPSSAQRTAHPRTLRVGRVGVLEKNALLQAFEKAIVRETDASFNEEGPAGQWVIVKPSAGSCRFSQSLPVAQRVIPDVQHDSEAQVSSRDCADRDDNVPAVDVVGRLACVAGEVS